MKTRKTQQQASLYFTLPRQPWPLFLLERSDSISTQLQNLLRRFDLVHRSLPDAFLRHNLPANVCKAVNVFTKGSRSRSDATRNAAQQWLIAPGGEHASAAQIAAAAPLSTLSSYKLRLNGAGDLVRALTRQTSPLVEQSPWGGISSIGEL